MCADGRRDDRQAARHVCHRASQLSGLVRSENAANLPVKAAHENDTTTKLGGEVMLDCLKFSL